ncbi:hypothetical protein BASA83_011605 [Batrachochytrium salamandrivorans]|nr:hypothetical protein BASA83_011605 [Batrachochytrium salamandrivorans]
MAAEVTPAIQDDGVAPTVTPIADVEMCLTINIYHILDYTALQPSQSLPPLHSRSNPGSPDGACLQDRPRTTKHGARFRITVPEDRQRNIIQRLERPKQANPLAYSAKLPTSPSRQPRQTAPPPPLSRQILAVNVANISNKRPAIANRQEHQALGHLRDLHYFLKISALLSLDSMSFSIQPLGPGRRGIALGIPSCFGGHEHGSAVGTMILAKVPNFTPRMSVDSRICLFSGSQITRLSTVHGRRHSSIDHFVCNAPARALLTSPRVDRQTAVADHFVIRTSIRAEAQGQPPAPRAPIISRHHCLEATDRIATSNYWDVLSRRNTVRQAFIAAATHTNPDPVQCNTLRDEWSRLRLLPPNSKEWMVVKQWVKHADNLDRAVSDGRTDLVFSAARAMSGNSSRSAAVTPLYNSDGIVQYDPTSILRVMQGHYESLAADTTGHSLDLQYCMIVSLFKSLVTHHHSKQ